MENSINLIVIISDSGYLNSSRIVPHTKKVKGWENSNFPHELLTEEIYGLETKNKL